MTNCDVCLGLENVIAQQSPSRSPRNNFTEELVQGGGVVGSWAALRTRSGLSTPTLSRCFAIFLDRIAFDRQDRSCVHSARDANDNVSQHTHRCRANARQSRTRPDARTQGRPVGHLERCFPVFCVRNMLVCLEAYSNGLGCSSLTRFKFVSIKWYGAVSRTHTMLKLRTVCTRGWLSSVCGKLKL